MQEVTHGEELGADMPRVYPAQLLAATLAYKMEQNSARLGENYVLVGGERRGTTLPMSSEIYISGTEIVRVQRHLYLQESPLYGRITESCHLAIVI